ncbi:MAG TPA: hypothetical protein VM096_20265 [Vicinamibacterales bacterium]|nr:hypothetical protein [Vicinamibacterales bacterium]
MTSYDCPHQEAVVNAVLSGQWPNGSDEQLLAHSKQCLTCREVANVSLLLREDLDQGRFDMHVPAAGQVWWRAAVRARLESTHAAARPITWMHAITGAITLGIMLAIVTAVWPMLPNAMAMVRSIGKDYLPNAEVANALALGLRQSLFIASIAAALLILTPLALYFVLSDD